MREAISTEPTGVVLRRGSGLPIYRQVVDQLRYLIAAGRYRVGEYLPPMRQVADELGLNLNTVLRAYAELQRDGLIESTRGKGARVVRVEADSTSLPRRASGDVSESIDAMISSAVEHALSAGLDPLEVLAKTQAAIDSAGRRAPQAPTIGLLATPNWRAREMADALRSLGIGRIKPVEDATGAIGLDLVVRPLFGGLDTVPETVGAPTLDVALLLDRTCVRELLEIDPRASVVVVAGDDRAVTWLTDAVAGYAGVSTVKSIVAESLSDADLSGASVVVVERGMPRRTTSETSTRILVAGAVFPASIVQSISDRLQGTNEPRSPAS